MFNYKVFVNRMGNLHGNGAAANASTADGSGKSRRNSNVKGRMLARFGHRSRSKAVLSAAEDEFSNVLERLADVVAPSTTTTLKSADAKLPLDDVEVDDAIDKRISFISQSADSAKDALDCGECHLDVFGF